MPILLERVSSIFKKLCFFSLTNIYSFYIKSPKIQWGEDISVKYLKNSREEHSNTITVNVLVTSKYQLYIDICINALDTQVYLLILIKKFDSSIYTTYF